MLTKLKMKTGGSRYQTLQGAESTYNHVQVSHRAITAFKRKARQVTTIYGDTEEARIRLSRLEAARPNIAAAIAQEKGSRRSRYGLSGQASAFRSRRGKWIANFKPVKPEAPKDNTAKIVADTEAVKTILRRLVKPEVVDHWLNQSIPLLGHRTPMDTIRRGEVKHVIEVLARVEEGIHL